MSRLNRAVFIGALTYNLPVSKMTINGVTVNYYNEAQAARHSHSDVALSAVSAYVGTATDARPNVSAM